MASLLSTKHWWIVCTSLLVLFYLKWLFIHSSTRWITSTSARASSRIHYFIRNFSRKQPLLSACLSTFQKNRYICVMLNFSTKKIILLTRRFVCHQDCVIFRANKAAQQILGEWRSSGHGDGSGLSVSGSGQDSDRYCTIIFLIIHCVCMCITCISVCYLCNICLIIDYYFLQQLTQLSYNTARWWRWPHCALVTQTDHYTRSAQTSDISRWKAIGSRSWIQVWFSRWDFFHDKHEGTQKLIHINLVCFF